MLSLIGIIADFSSNREPFKLKALFRFHNAILSSGSLLLLVLLMEEV